jgi:hypothetical protein
MLMVFVARSWNTNSSSVRKAFIFPSWMRCTLSQVRP